MRTKIPTLASLIQRQLAEPVQQALDQLLKSVVATITEPMQWADFYRLVVVSYRANRSERPSVSQLFEVLQERGIEDANRLAVLYAHGLFILALANGRKIYGREFQV